MDANRAADERTGSSRALTVGLVVVLVLAAAGAGVAGGYFWGRESADDDVEDVVVELPDEPDVSVDVDVIADDPSRIAELTEPIEEREARTDALALELSDLSEQLVSTADEYEEAAASCREIATSKP